MIKKLSVSNWKGITGSFDLSAATMFTGPNGSGKSAMLEAIVVALSGYTDLGNKPAYTMQLASGAQCEITIESNDGHILSRSFTTTAKGVTAQVIRLDGMIIKQADLVLPASMSVPVEAIHPAEFLAMSGDKRAAFLFGKIETAKTADIIDTKTLPAIVSILGMKDGKSAGDLLPLFATALSETKKEIERAVANIQKLTGAAGDLPAGTIDEWQKKLTDIDAQLETLVKEQAQSGERDKGIAARAKRISEIESRLSQAVGHVEESEKKIADVTAKINALGALPANADQSDTTVIRSSIKTREARATEIAVTSRDIRARLKQITDHGKCPTCGTVADNLGPIIDEWDILLCNLDMEAEAVAGEIATLVAEMARRENEAKSVELRDRLQLDRRVTETALKSYRSYRDEQQSDLAKAKAETKQSDTDPGKAKALADTIEALRAQKETARAAVKAITGANAVIQQRSASEEDRRRFEARKAMTEAAIAHCKQARDQALTKMSGAIGAPFSKSVSSAFKGCMSFFQVVGDDGKPAVDFGIVRDGRRVSFDTMSGGERLVVLVALQAAIQIAATGKAKLCLVEMAEADLQRVIGVAAAVESIGFEQAVLASCHVAAFEAIDIGYAAVDMTAARGGADKAVAS